MSSEKKIEMVFNLPKRNLSKSSWYKAILVIWFRYDFMILLRDASFFSKYRDVPQVCDFIPVLDKTSVQI